MSRHIFERPTGERDTLDFDRAGEVVFVTGRFISPEYAEHEKQWAEEALAEEILPDDLVVGRTFVRGKLIHGAVYQRGLHATFTPPEQT